MKYFTIFALALLIIYAMQVDAKGEKSKDKSKDKAKDKDKGKTKAKEEEVKDDKSEDVEDESDISKHKKGKSLGSGECKDNCPKKLTPVCGYNEKCYKLFDDKCKMELENCEHEEYFKEAEMDECSNEDNTKCESDK